MTERKRNIALSRLVGKEQRKLQRFEVDWSNDQDVLDFFESKWALRNFYYRGRHKRWLETIACYEGFWYYDFDTALRRFSDASRIPPWRIRLAINLLLPRVRTLVSKLLRNRPTFDVLPATADTNNIAIANRSKKVLRGYWYQQYWNDEFIDILFWLALTGNAYLYIHWDPFSGPLYTPQVTDFLDPQTIQQAGSEQQVQDILQRGQDKFMSWRKKSGGEIFLGDVRWYVPTPFDILFPISNDIFRRKQWVIMSQMRNISYYESIGIDTKDMHEPDFRDKQYLRFIRRLDAISSLDTALDLTGTETDNEEEVLEKQCWLSPGEDLKHGFHCTIAGKKVIHKSLRPDDQQNPRTNKSWGIPYKHNEIPIVHLVAEKTPGKTLGFSSAEQSVPQIREYQKSRSQLLEVRNLMGKPKWLSPKTAKLHKAAITSEPGEIIEYSGILPPAAVPPPNVPRYFFDLQAADIRDLDEIFAQRDASKGINQPGVRSGTQNINLQDQDDGSLAILGIILNTGVSRGGRLTLSTIDQFVSEDRITAYLGKKKRYESIYYGKGSLSGDDKLPGTDYYNVTVTDWTQYGLSRTGQLEFLRTLLQYQIFTAQDRDKVFDFISMGYFEDEIDEFQVDRSNAYQENLLFTQGKLQVGYGPQYTDHHPTHLEEHKSFVNENWGQLPQQVIGAVIYHIQLTELEIIKAAVRPQILQYVALAQVMKEEGVPPQILAAQQQTEGNSNGRQTNGQSGSRQGSSGSSGSNGQRVSAAPSGGGGS